MSKFKIRLILILSCIIILTIISIVFSIFYIHNRGIEGFYILKTIQHYYVNENENEIKLKVPLLLININNQEVKKEIHLENSNQKINAEFLSIENIGIVDDIYPYEFNGNIVLKLITIKIDLSKDINAIEFDEIYLNDKIFNIGNIKITRENFEKYSENVHDFSYKHYSQGEIEYIELESNLSLSYDIKSIENDIEYKINYNDNNALISINNPFLDEFVYIKRQYLIVCKNGNKEINIMPKETRSYIEPRISKLLKFA